MTATPMPDKTKKCVVCNSEIPANAEICPICRCEPDGQQCDNCKKWMPLRAKFCNECKAYQSWRQYFNVGAIVLSLFGAFLGVSRTLHLAATYLSERDSHTKFKVTSADDRHVYLRVWNTGRKPSALVGYRLKFNGNPPLKDATLQLSDDDAAKAKNIVVSGRPAKIELTTSGTESLEILPNAGNEQNTKAKISTLLGSQTVLLEIDVEESDDPTAGFWHWIEPRKFHTRSEAFPIDRIKSFVVWNMR